MRRVVREEPKPEPTPQPQQSNLLVVVLIALAFFAGSSTQSCQGPVVPPGPGPVPPLVVPDPPIKQGKRCVVVLFESQRQSPAFSRLRIALQAGESRDYLKRQGHQLYFLDEQQKDANGQILDVIDHLKQSLGGKKTPAVFVCEDINGKCGKVLHVEAITDATTADDVIEYIRRGGG